MRILARNRQKFYYYLYKDRVPLYDENGNRTGEYTLTYHPAVECKGNISAGSGDAQVELFGTDIQYSKVIVLDDVKCPIDETTLLCVDIEPQSYDESGVPVYDYYVTAVAKSLNSVAIAINKVKVDENQG